MKKVIFVLLGLFLSLFIVSVFFIGGKLGACLWCAAVFVIAPVAAVITVIQIINLCIRLFRKKKIFWNFIYILISMVYTLPILILLGVSPVTYPTYTSDAACLEITAPVKDAVYFGGKSYKTHAYWPSECYAYDILKEPYDIGSNNLLDYGIFGEDVSCPVSGTVIGIENEELDIKPNLEEFTSSLGNYIFIEVDATGTYIILAHLMENSIVVSVGDHVTEGVYLGKVGNSGTTSEPHLHVQHQRDNPLNMKFPCAAEGLPIRFKDK